MDRAVHAEKDLLSQVLGGMDIAQETPGQGVYAGEVVVEESFQSPRVTGTDPLELVPGRNMFAGAEIPAGREVGVSGDGNGPLSRAVDECLASGKAASRSRGMAGKE